MWTGSPPPSCDRLDGVVNGVNASFAVLGYGTSAGNTRGPRGPATPCDSSRIGRPPTTRQISSPSAGRLASKPFLRAVLQQEVLAAVGPDQHLEALLRRVLDRRQDQLLLDRRVDDGRLDPAELLLAPGARSAAAGRCRAWLDISAPDAERPRMPGFSGRAYRSGRPSMWPNSWQKTLMLSIRSPPSGQMKYGHACPCSDTLERCGQYRLPRGRLHPAAGVHEEHAVEALQRVLAVAGEQLVERLGQQGRAVAARCRTPPASCSPRRSRTPCPRLRACRTTAPGSSRSCCRRPAGRWRWSWCRCPC